jgi:hypothetical protein
MAHSYHTHKAYDVAVQSDKEALGGFKKLCPRVERHCARVLARNSEAVAGQLRGRLQNVLFAYIILITAQNTADKFLTSAFQRRRREDVLRACNRDLHM